MKTKIVIDEMLFYDFWHFGAFNISFIATNYLIKTGKNYYSKYSNCQFKFNIFSREE